MGFSEKRLVDAAIEQFKQLPCYHSFSPKTNAPASALAAKLAELAPGDLNHVFFTNSGSEANDSMVKMVWYVNSAPSTTRSPSVRRRSPLRLRRSRAERKPGQDLRAPGQPRDTRGARDVGRAAITSKG